MESAYDKKVGQNVFIRSFPHHYIGKLIEVYPRELVVQDASWIADSGRWMQALATGDLSEVEPYPDGEEVIVPRGNICDVSTWLHALPREQK